MVENVKPTKEEALQGLVNPLDISLQKQGITADYLTQKLKEELEAKETKVFNDKLGIIYSKDLIAWPVRQKARQDAHKLRGDYPAEKTEHSGHVTLEEIIKAQDAEKEK